MKGLFSKILLFLFFTIALFFQLNAQDVDTHKVIVDTNIVKATADTLAKDSLKNKTNSNALTHEVDFNAQDSIYIDLKHNKIFMFGDTKLTTKDMKLESHLVKIFIRKNEIEADQIQDSTTKQIFRPQFSDGKQNYIARKMRFNFKTRKGIVYDVITQEDQGYLHGEIVKIFPNKEIHIKKGKYTTCNKPHPHFYVELTKAKVLPKHRIVTGPFYLVIADVPLPLGLPFGFFPNTSRRTTGFIFPQPYEEKLRGFGLTNGGYYWAINDYMDMKILADVFTTGSWTGRYTYRYFNRYKFNSTVHFEFSHIRNGEKILRDFYVSNTFNLQISYNQAQKARPNSHFSANINFIKGNHRQFNAQTIEQFTNNTTNSSISYQHTFAGTPFNMTANFNATQNLSDSTINIRFPTINFTMRRIYPFKKLVKIPKGAWYEKIGFNLNSTFQNTVFTRDSVLYKHPDSLLKMMKNGFQYSTSTNTSFHLFKFFNITPSFNYVGRIYTHKIIKRLYNTEDTQYYKLDTVWGLNHNFNFNFNAGLNTTLYGLFRLNMGKIKAIRHVMRPSIGYTLSPDFSKDFWGFYYRDPQDSSRRLSYTADGIFGSPPQGEQQTLSIGVSNNFEMKVASSDTSNKQKFKKIRLLDRLNIFTSYNFAKDSLNWNDISLNAGATLFPGTSFSFSSAYTLYSYDKYTGRPVNRFMWQDFHKLFRMKNLNFTFNTSLSSQKFKKKNATHSEQQKHTLQAGNWNFTLSYSFNMSETYDPEALSFTYNYTQYLRISLNMQLTQNLSSRISTGYDFNAGKITSTEISMNRDLHCWEMGIRVIPFGRMKSYMFHINAKASIFQSLKFTRQRSFHDNF